MTRVYLVRHAQAVANVTGYCYGVSECDVTEEGKEQLVKLAERFRNIPIDKIYASPMKRTLATANAVNKYHDVPLLQEPGVIEINAGAWEMKMWDDLKTLYPDEFEIWTIKPHLWKTQGAETMSEVFHRMKNTVDNLARENKNKTIVVVSHACALRNYFCHARGLPHERMVDIRHMMNTGVGCVEYDDELNCTVLFENDISHLVG